MLRYFLDDDSQCCAVNIVDLIEVGLANRDSGPS